MRVCGHRDLVLVLLLLLTSTTLLPFLLDPTHPKLPPPTHSFTLPTPRHHPSSLKLLFYGAYHTLQCTLPCPHHTPAPSKTVGECSGRSTPTRACHPPTIGTLLSRPSNNNALSLRPPPLLRSSFLRLSLRARNVLSTRWTAPANPRSAMPARSPSRGQKHLRTCSMTFSRTLRYVPP